MEIEIKAKVEQSKKLLVFLDKNAKFLHEEHQTDEYFSAPHRNFLATRPVKEWLRLRNAGSHYSFNYKNWIYGSDGKTNHCDEFETSIGDIGQLKNILQVLNFKSMAVVDKVRRSWLYQNYEISLDLVKGLGEFVEIEYKGDTKDVDPAKIAKGMMDFLKKLDCGEIKREYKGYPFLILFPEEIEYEKQ